MVKKITSIVIFAFTVLFAKASLGDSIELTPLTTQSPDSTASSSIYDGLSSSVTSDIIVWSIFGIGLIMLIAVYCSKSVKK